MDSVTQDLRPGLAPQIRMLAFAGALVPLYLSALMIFAVGALVGWPKIDTMIWPVLVDQQVSQVTYDPKARHVCWVWEFTKVQDAKAVNVAFHVTDRGGDEMSVSPWRQDTGNAFDARAPKRKAGRHRIPLCAKLSEEIDSPWVVNGYIDYETSRWWLTRTWSPPIVPADGVATPGGG